MPYNTFIHTETPMKLNKNQLAFIIDAIVLATPQMIDDRYYEEKDNWVKEWISVDGKYKLTENEVDELALLISEELQ